MGDTGFTLTNQRAIILEFLKENYNHPSVEDIFDSIKHKLPRISKKTVYSNLKFLSEHGMITEVNVKGVYRYEPKIHPHHHILCKSCGEIIDFESDKLTKISMALIKEIKGFNVDSSSTNFYVTCKKCKVKLNDKIRT